MNPNSIGPATPRSTNNNKAIQELEDKIKRQNIIRKSIRYSVVFGIVAIAFFALKIDLLNSDKDSFTFTNYGLAVMFAYSSICFSWARNIIDEKMAKKVNFIARTSLYTGIVFLMGSIFKYIIHINGGNVFLFSYNVTFIPLILSKSCIVFAILSFCVQSLQIMKVVDEENHRSKMDQLKKFIGSKKYLDTIEKELMEIINKNTRQDF